MSTDTIIKLGFTIAGGIASLLIGAWRLSKIWTRMESSLTINTKATSDVSAIATQTRDAVHSLTDTVNGRLGKLEMEVWGVDGTNGLRGRSKAQAADIENLKEDRRTAISPRRKSQRSGGRRKGDRAA